MKIDFRKAGIIWYFFKPYKAQLLILLFVMLSSGFMEMLNLAALYPVMNYGLKLENSNFLLILFNEIIVHFATDNYFFVSCVALIVITVIAVIFKFAYSFLSNKLVMRIVGDTQKAVFRKYITSDYDFFVKSQQGKLIHTVTIAPEQVTNMILFTIRLTHDLISSLFLFSLLLVLTWQGTFLLVSIGVVYMLFVKRIMKRVIYRCAAIATEEDRKKNVILNEFINGIKAIKIFFTFNDWETKYVSAVDESLHNRFKMLLGRVFPESFMKFIFFAMLAVFGILLSRRSPQDLILAIPLFGTFVMVASRFFPSIQMVGNDLMVITDCIPNTKIVHTLCMSKLANIPDGTDILKEFNGKIAFEDVWFKYDNMPEYLLKGVTFGIKKREITAIVGPSGSGKTTIINLLLKLYRPETGEIKIDGTDIFSYTNRSYLDKIGYVGQETFIFNDTVKENIRFGMQNCSDDMIIRAAKLANAHEFIVNTRDGYNTLVGDAGVKLSGGQRQRVAIARAMLREPEILVFDEATSSLDNIAEKNVQEAINRVSQHTTVVMVAHRLSTIQNADKIVVLDNGSIWEEGTHTELMGNNGLYFNLYTKQDIFMREKI